MTVAEKNPADRAKYLILGTAGHIDHGKTSLVKALTDTDTDRLPEEKRRGMTIELGFAHLAIGDVEFGIVDVPGHERFVRTMVAGATGIDVALIVVAGDDSVMPQTVEHVEVLRLVGIEHAVVAITKSDLVDVDMLDLVEDEVRSLLKGTPLAGAKFVRVSSASGRGIEELKTTLAEVAKGVPHRARKGPFRLAVDRVFTVPGRGTVVTGSVLCGQIRASDTLNIYPGGGACRVREMQSHGESHDAIQSGQRAALNLIGIDRREIDHGFEVVTPGYIEPALRTDAAFEVLATCKRPVKPFTKLRICMGTRETFARVATLDRADVPPGGAAYVQLRSREPFFAAYGQRFIAREENGARTIGGGVVMRPNARRWLPNRDTELRAIETLRSGATIDRLKQVLIESGFESPPTLRLAARTGIGLDELPALLDRLVAGDDYASVDGTARRAVPACIDGLFDRADRWLERYHKSHADEPGCHVDALTGWLERKSAVGLGRPLFMRYTKSERAKVHGRYVCLPAFAPAMSARDERGFDAIVVAFREGAYQPPSLDILTKKLDRDLKDVKRLVKLAVAYGELVEIDKTIQLSTEHETNMRRTVAGMIDAQQAVTVAEVKERLNSSRKYAVPLMEYLDRVGFTVRRGDSRVLHENASI